MKHSVALLLAILTQAYASKQAEFLPSDYFAVRKDEVLSLASGLNLVADTLSVSICPRGAICMRADHAFVSLRVTSGTQSRRVRLSAFPYSRQGDSSGVDFGDALYKVILRSYRCARDSSNRVTSEVTVQVAKL